MDQNNQFIHFYNLKGESYSNTFQIEGVYEVFNRFDLTAAYRINDVKTTFTNELRQVPFVSKYKGLLSATYRTNLDKWQFDYTVQFHGNQRLPYTQGNQPQNIRSNQSEDYVIMLAQITKNYRNWSFYAGAENLGNFTQKEAIIAPTDPFGTDFDACRIWGPVFGRMVYMGIKYTLDKD
jgi:hypothetical protein